MKRQSTRKGAGILEALEERRLLSGADAGIGVYRPGTMLLDYNIDQTADASIAAQTSAKQAYSGDFDGDTLTDTAYVIPSTTGAVYEIDLGSDGTVDRRFTFAGAGKPVFADINGDGRTDIGRYYTATGKWSFDLNFDGVADRTIIWSAPSTATVLAGDVTGDGYADLVQVNAGTWSVDSNLDGKSELSYKFSGTGLPFLADVNGDTVADLGYFNNGQWSVDQNRDGTADRTFTFGQAGDRPLVGFFDTRDSVFVRPGASNANTGAWNSPVGTIAEAIRRTGSNSTVRVAAGIYRENLYFYTRSNFNFLGAGYMASKIAPASGDAMFVDRTSCKIVGIGFKSGDRGLVVAGSNVTGLGIATRGTVNRGVLSTSYLGSNSTLKFRQSHFDRMVTGDAVRLQSGTTVDFRYCTFSYNGTDFSSIPRGLDGGRGLVIEDHCAATIDASRFEQNAVSGISTTDDASFTLTNSYVGYSQHFNNIHIDGRTSAVISRNIIENAGTIRDVGKGFNGIEIVNAYAGLGLTITSNTFRNNTSSGIYVGNGRGHVISGNMFDNNVVGVNLNGYLEPGISTGPIDVYAKVTANTFVRSTGSTDSMQVGIFALGSNAHGQIGGSAAADYNTFWNYASGNSIFRARHGGKPWGDYGVPDLTILNNNYYNSPNPTSVVY